MTIATKKLIDKLSKIVDQNKYLLLSGGSATGKTFLAFEIAKRCSAPEFNCQGDLSVDKSHYDIELELVPIHDSFSYEDFVTGVGITTVNGHIDFRYMDKIFLSLLKKANKSWKKSENKKYFLILDNIERGSISGLLGDTLSLIEPHKSKNDDIFKLNSLGIWMSPNIYIIATRNTSVTSNYPFYYGLFRHFYEYELKNDYKFMSDWASHVYSEYDISANAMFYRSKKIVLDHLKHRYNLPISEREKYVIGHGVFKDFGISLRMKYQIIPLLKQYLKDGVLERTAKIDLEAFHKLIEGKYSKDFSSAEMNRIITSKKDITSTRFYNDKTTHQPMVNLVTRIKEQGLLDDVDIANSIMFNPQVLIRKKAKIDGNERYFQNPGYLYVVKENRDIYTYGTTVDRNGRSKRPRFFYSGSNDDCLKVDDISYSVASEMQPGEYTRWYEDLDSDKENERYSSSPNSILFRILRNYYKLLVQHYGDYLLENPNDENITNLHAFANEEYKQLVNETKKLHPEISDEKEVNSKANDDFRRVVSSLILLWKNRGEIINVGGKAIKVEGVYKVNNKDRYEEYSKAMDMLGIHQMIMQGPPGTSKTYCAREYLKFIGSNSQDHRCLSDDELDALQIQDYTQGADLCKWTRNNREKTPVIAWDIVQFHPSYGYEDFVRGIEVRTIESKNDNVSSISYDTVNKILGKMAEVAAREEYRNTKFYLIIDEINRANLATVFGELIYGLEYRGRSVSTPYTVDESNKVKLPDNLYIIGTMNTADKSIGGIDYAIRRRFLFFSLLPDREIILKYNISNNTDIEQLQQGVINQKAVALFDRISELFNSENLNSEYYKDDIQIGHTYFLVKNEEQLYLRFRYQIIPILKEYYKDGMFQFDKPETYNDGWSGLVGCIMGEIDINSDEDSIKSVFDQLIASA